MHAKQLKIHSAVDPIPFPRQREMLTELRETDDRLRGLREKVESGDEAASVARNVALLYVDLIARVHALSTQLDGALDGQMFVADQPFRENVRRARAALSIYARLNRMMLEATEGLFKCLGGQNVITLQSLAGWGTQHAEAETMISALEQQTQRIERILSK